MQSHRRTTSVLTPLHPVFTGLLLWLLCVCATGASANNITCVPANQSGGNGIRITQNCTAVPDAGWAADEAYYLVVAQVVPEAGFEDNARFQRKSAGDKIVSSLLSTLFDTDKATVVSLEMVVTADKPYPPVTLISFTKTDENEWTSHLNTETRTLLHRLNPGDDFEIKFTFHFSRNRSFSLDPASKILDDLGVKVFTPAMEPVLAAANTVGKAILASGNVVSSSDFDRDLAPWEGRMASSKFQILDIKTGKVIATVSVALEGTRSLLAPPRALPGIAAALPSGIVSTDTLDRLAGQLASGDARRWRFRNSALAGAELQAIPLGKVIDAGSAATFCSGVRGGLNSNFALTGFDSVLVTASLLDEAAASIRKTLNPYPKCFPDSRELEIINAHLAIDTKSEPEKPSKELKDADSLFLLACYFTKSDDCGPVSGLRDRTRDLLADEVKIEALEGVTVPALILPPGSSRVIPRDEFLNRFNGAFARYKEVSGASGWLHVRETQDGELLRATFAVNAAGKVTSITIRRP